MSALFSLHRHPCFRRFLILKLLLVLIFLAYFLDIHGFHRHLLEIDYETGFSYPLEGNVATWVDKLMDGAKDGDTDEIPTPLRQFDHSILIDAVRVCRNSSSSSNVKPSLVLVVKSACDHILNRAAIRHTWCQMQNRYHGSVQCVFFVARRPGNSILERKIQLEANEHGDMVLVDFVDNYFNNTLKLMAAFRWALDSCTSTNHFLFVDDDFYISVPNLMRFISTLHIKGHVVQQSHDKFSINKHGYTDNEFEDEGSIIVGYVHNGAPYRSKWSKWFIPLDEYPFSLWPPYCAAGAFIVSKRTLHRLVLASRFTKFFRVDDVYVGLLAKKLEIRPRHSYQVALYPEEYRTLNYSQVIAVHGFGEPRLLEQSWNQQHQLGLA